MNANVCITLHLGPYAVQMSSTEQSGISNQVMPLIIDARSLGFNPV